jgi:predicted RNase H-like HicB family nuclease
MSEMRYPVVIHKDKTSDYSVSVPDLPGCFSAGDTLEDALTHAVEAIGAISVLLLDGGKSHRHNPSSRI